MIAVMGVVEAEAGQIDALDSVLRAMMTATQEEQGCIQYIFSRDITHGDRLLISELWQDEAALAAHFATPHMATFNAAISVAKILKINVKRHDIATTSQLIGGD